MKKRIAAEENIIEVKTTYARTHQGIILTSMIDTEFTEILQLVELCEMFKEFVEKQYGKVMKKYNFYSKFSTPMVVCVDDCLKLALCYVAKDSDEAERALQDLKIEKENEVRLK